jgi:hypothetical protein
MRRSQRLIAAGLTLALCTVLGGCSSGLSSWDPTDMLDFLDTKKKLPGERKPVFPDGVPGLEQGVPKELYKGARQDQLDQQNADAAAAPAPAAPPPEPAKGKRHAKGKGKPASATASTAPTAEPPAAEPDAATGEEGAPAAVPPAPKPKKIARKRTTAPPPDQPAEPAAAPAQPAQQSAFPAPLPSGSFTR